MNLSDIYAHKKFPVLDHGYVQFVEAYGHGIEGEGVADFYSQNETTPDYEVGIIEAARMSTQKGFLGWEPGPCPMCLGAGETSAGFGAMKCPTCEGKGTLRGDFALLDFLDKKKHSTPFEMAGMIIEIQAPIAVFREWHRHRTQSYAEMSGRYAPVPNVNYMPTLDRCFLKNEANKQANAMKDAPELTPEAAQVWLAALEDAYKASQEAYQFGLDNGIPKELARLSNNVGRYSRMRATANLRNWCGFLTLRSTAKGPDAMFEIRAFADVVGEIASLVFPKTMSLFAR